MVRTIHLITLTLVAAAIATPIGQAAPPTQNLAGQTEAKGYLAITRALVSQSQAPDLPGRTEAKGYLAITRALVSQSQAPDLAGRTEAKGYQAISRYLASLATPRQTEGLPSSQCPCNLGLPGGVAGGSARQTASVPPSQCPCNIGLPIQAGGVDLVTAPPSSGSYISDRSSLGSTGTLQTEGLPSSQCPCNLGLPDGPNGVEQVGTAPTKATKPRASFDWGDAGIGAGLMAGIGTLAAGAALMLRRHRPLAQLHS
jgi:hypothetical protein